MEATSGEGSMGGSTRGRGRTGEGEDPISKEEVVKTGSGSKVGVETVATVSEVGAAGGLSVRG